jgi:hypothetical protein
MIVAFVCLYALALGEFISKPACEDFQDQVYEDFKANHMRTPIFSFQSNEVRVLEHIAPTYFSVYSVELELHLRKCLNHTSFCLCHPVDVMII